jgi:type I restriction enzyme M protein
MRKKRFPKGQVFFLNPRTCGIYKNGGTRFRVDKHGARTERVDNELLEHVEGFVSGAKPEGMAVVPLAKANAGVLVPRYFDNRWDEPFEKLKAAKKFDELTLGELIDKKVIFVRGGHGSPGNDQRVGDVPYVKVSDIRNLRININPTNMIPLALAKKFWRSPAGDSGLRAWDIVTPNRASSNIGEFAVVLPGEERIVLTKEMFLFRVVGGKKDGWDPFYLLWALCLRAVRMQWQRVTLMQTNREDVADRYREIRLPKPISQRWAQTVSAGFRSYFKALASSSERFHEATRSDGFEYIASVLSSVPEIVPRRVV